MAGRHIAADTARLSPLKIRLSGPDTGAGNLGNQSKAIIDERF